MQRENLVALRLAFDALAKYGRASLEAAYDFGQIIDALSNLYTYKVMGEEVDRHSSTIAMYAKLYRMYPNKQELLDTAERYQTWDVSKLSKGDSALRAIFHWHCLDCGSVNVKKVKEPENARALQRRIRTAQRRQRKEHLPGNRQAFCRRQVLLFTSRSEVYVGQVPAENPYHSRGNRLMPGPCTNRRKTEADRLSGKAASHLRNRRARADYNRRLSASQKQGGMQLVPPPVIGIHDGAR